MKFEHYWVICSEIWALLWYQLLDINYWGRLVIVYHLLEYYRLLCAQYEGVDNAKIHNHSLNNTLLGIRNCPTMPKFHNKSPNTAQ